MSRADIAKSAMLLAVAFAWPAVAQANTVYKWTDQRGVVNYSTTPPSAGQRASTVDISPSVGLPALAQTAAEIRACFGVRVVEVVGDITTKDGLAAVLAQAL